LQGKHPFSRDLKRLYISFLGMVEATIPKSPIYYGKKDAYNCKIELSLFGGAY